MSYSNNIEQLTGKNDTKDAVVRDVVISIRQMLNQKKQDRLLTPDENDFTPEISNDTYSPPYAPTSPTTPPYIVNNQVYDPNSPPYSAILGRVMTEEEFNNANNNSPESPPYVPYTPPDTPPGGDFMSPTSVTQINSPGYVPNSPPYDPNSPPYAPDEQSGGGNRYEVGERVCVRNCKDNYPTRPWKVTHVGPKFITVSAIDTTGLADSETLNVLTPFDIYPEEQAHIQFPNIPLQTQELQNGGHIQPIPQQTQPSIVIAPKFFNGNGSDNSTNEKQPDNVSMDHFLNSTEPNIVVKNDTKDPSITSQPKNDDIDFSNIVIKKAN